MALVELVGDVLQAADTIVEAIVEGVVGDQFTEGALTFADPINQALNLVYRRQSPVV